jgi:hypothetical protein
VGKGDNGGPEGVTEIEGRGRRRKEGLFDVIAKLGRKEGRGENVEGNSLVQGFI